MSNVSAAPNNKRMLESTGLPTLAWILFFSYLSDGDSGTTFVPTATGLGSVGSPTIVGAYYRSGSFIDYYIYITPATSTTSTAGTTYFSLPFDVKQDGPCFAVGSLSGATGMTTASDNRVYPPAWAAATYPITVSGRVLAS